MKKQEYTGRYQTKRKSPPARRRSPLVRVLFAMVALAASAATGLGVYAWQLDSSDAQFRDLAALTQHSAQVTAHPTAESLTLPLSDVQPIDQVEPTEPPQAETEPKKTILPQYEEISQQNPDFWGWISIADTQINYPVMHTPQEPEKYLYADFQGNYSFPGTPFLDERCSSDSDNLMIYSHNMNNGTMFHGLLKYDSSTYWRSHPTIQLDTLYESREYEIIAAFYDRIYRESETAFRFYQLIDAQDEAEFDSFVAQLTGKSLYDTGITAAYGDQLLMLITCSAHTDNGRFVLVARWKSE